jgi:hypothetical protein
MVEGFPPYDKPCVGSINRHNVDMLQDMCKRQLIVWVLGVGMMRINDEDDDDDDDYLYFMLHMM